MFVLIFFICPRISQYNNVDCNVFKEFQAYGSNEDAILRYLTKAVHFLCNYPHSFDWWCFLIIIINICMYFIVNLYGTHAL